MQGVSLIADDDRVTGVRAAVVSDNDIVPAGEKVNDLAFSLVAPLQADDGCVAPSVVIGTSGPVVGHGESQAC